MLAVAHKYPTTMKNSCREYENCLCKLMLLMPRNPLPPPSARSSPDDELGSGAFSDVTLSPKSSRGVTPRGRLEQDGDDTVSIQSRKSSKKADKKEKVVSKKKGEDNDDNVSTHSRKSGKSTKKGDKKEKVVFKSDGENTDDNASPRSHKSSKRSDKKDKKKGDKRSSRKNKAQTEDEENWKEPPPPPLPPIITSVFALCYSAFA
ncbi:hypothetical protein CBR_g29570 [Chara braunii]|uniref:Uncharacterized protein n=1 Tax=Chara braunii TaxID=69332 RepID=A0A388LB66_CHABU|nr:hypothetical protein CBR_g29570 [Chara braunii]|eukprot:GBG79423.1 hypothetical protein CBR_g29570 [Chara braunii]